MTGYYRDDGKYVSKKNQRYRDTYDELERIYAEVKAEQGDPGYIYKKPLPEQGYPATGSEEEKAQRQYDEMVKLLRYGNQKPKDFKGLKGLIAEPMPIVNPEPEPAGVTLEELFAEDEENEGTE